MEFSYVEAIIGFKILMYVFETYLNMLQYAAHKLTTFPEPLVGGFSVQNYLKFKRLREYSLDKSRFDFVRKFVSILLDLGILYFRMLPWLWKKSGEFLLHANLDPENEIWHTLAFWGCFMIWSKITNFPFSLYASFVIKGHHGFFKPTKWSFYKDKFKSIALSIWTGPLIVVTIILIVQKGGPYLAVYLWVSTFVISTALISIYPDHIAPLFNRFTPLRQGKVRKRVEKLATSVRFPLEKIFVVDSCTWSSHRNAFMCGFFNNKRIVFHDTLLLQLEEVREVVAVFAHELGHWKFNHTMYIFITVQLIMAMEHGVYTLVTNSKALFESSGFHDMQPVFIGIMIFKLTVYGPMERILRFAFNLMSRSCEFQADAYAKKLGYGKELRAALSNTLEDDDLGNTDSWYSAFYNSRPTVFERLSALE